MVRQRELVCFSVEASELTPLVFDISLERIKIKLYITTFKRRHSTRTENKALHKNIETIRIKIESKKPSNVIILLQMKCTVLEPLEVFEIKLGEKYISGKQVALQINK